MNDNEIEQIKLNGKAIGAQVAHIEKGIEHDDKKREVKRSKKRGSITEDGLLSHIDTDLNAATGPPVADDHIDDYADAAGYAVVKTDGVEAGRKAYVKGNAPMLMAFVDRVLSYRDMRAGADVEDTTTVFDMANVAVCHGYVSGDAAKFGLPSLTPEDGLMELTTGAKALLPHYFSQSAFNVKGAWLNDDEDAVRLIDLRRTYENFSHQFCFVLDDVGSKGRTKTEGLDCLHGSLGKPTAIIRSSKNSLQYVYFFSPDAVIHDINEAKGFCSAMSDTGLADKGGVTPTRLGRLPFGVNGKTNKRYEPVELLEFHPDRLHNPREMLRDAGVDTSLERLAHDSYIINKRGMSGARGEFKIDRLAQQGFVRSQSQGYELFKRDKEAALSFLSANWVDSIGGVDLAAELLHIMGLVVADMNEAGYLTIKCPYSHGHTGCGSEAELAAGTGPDGSIIALHRNTNITNNEVAGYAQAGARGDGVPPHFNCFHDSCAHRTTRDFILDLSRMAASLKLPSDLILRDTHNRLQWMLNNMAVATPNGQQVVYGQLTGVGGSEPLMSLKVMKEHYRGMATVCAYGEERQTGGVADMFANWPYRVTLGGTVDVPHRNDSGVATNQSGMPAINTRRYPRYVLNGGDGVVREEDRDVFERAFEHCIKDEGERHWLRQYVKEKYTNPMFRGGLLHFYSEKGGTGKSALAGLIGAGLGKARCGSVNMGQLLSSSGQSAFTEWLALEFVIVAEAKGVDNYVSNRAGFANVKSVTDTSATWMTMNGKYDIKRPVLCNTTVIICSNELDVLHGMEEDDRRVSIIPFSDEKMPADIAAAIYGALTDGAAHADAAKGEYMGHAMLRSFFNWIMETDMTGFDPTMPLDNGMRARVSAATMSVERQLYDTLLREAIAMPAVVEAGWVNLTALNDMFMAVGTRYSMEVGPFDTTKLKQAQMELLPRYFDERGQGRDRYMTSSGLDRHSRRKCTMRRTKAGVNKRAKDKHRVYRDVTAACFARFDDRDVDKIADYVGILRDD